MPAAGGLVYEARPQFRAYHHRKQRFAIGVAHRRAGKTVACIVDLLWKAWECKRERPRYAYLAPLYSQAKGVSWDYLRSYGEAMGGTAYEYELRLDLPNGGRVRLYGADNPDSLRGLYFDGVVLDEYAQMRPSVWPQVIRPALSDRLGWATFIGTVNGHDDFYKRYQDALSDPEWFTFMLKASETGLVPQGELESALKTMSPSKFSAEYECNFEAAVEGAYYGEQMEAAEKDGRIGAVPWQPAKPVETWWDLGRGHATAIWFVQRMPSGAVHIIDFYMAQTKGLDHFVKHVKSLPYTYSQHVAPHDIEISDYSAADDQSRRDIARSLGIDFVVAPKLLVDDGIEAVRVLLPRCYFDRQKCGRGLEALKLYCSEMDEKRGILRPTPVQDWFTDPADAFRTGAVASAPTDTWSTKLKYSNNGIV